MMDENDIREIINRRWPEERRATYMSPQDTEQLIHCPMRVRLKHEEKMVWVKLEIKMPDNVWREVAYCTLIDDVRTGIAYTMGDQEGGGGTFPLPSFKYTYGSFIKNGCLYLIRNYSDG